MSDPHIGLEIFIIGGRLGESIVIRTPGGRFGIVDAYASDWEKGDANPTLSRLKTLGAEELHFIALTHHHMDHFRGLPAIFEAYRGKVEFFWRPPWGAFEVLKALLREFKAETRHARRTHLGRSMQILCRLYDVADAEVKAKRLKIQTLQNDSEALYDGILFQEEEHDFTVMCLGPSTGMSTPYFEKLTAKALSPVKDKENPAWGGPHNEISAVLAIKYGDWIGVLGGDTERASWRDIIERRVSLLNSAQFFKVSHHGSDTGSFPELWESVQSEKCEAVITCFASRQLPNASGLQYLDHSRFSLHSTNSELATQLYGGRSKPVPVELKISNRSGEVRVAVTADGEMTVNHIEPAGPLHL
jgi:beta-lactamase superfamily II metal-dependent hydrolase